MHCTKSSLFLEKAASSLIFLLPKLKVLVQGVGVGIELECLVSLPVCFQLIC